MSSTRGPSSPSRRTVVAAVLCALAPRVQAQQTGNDGQALDHRIVVSRTVQPRIAYRGIALDDNPVRVQATTFPGRMFQQTLDATMERLVGSAHAAGPTDNPSTALGVSDEGGVRAQLQRFGDQLEAQQREIGRLRQQVEELQLSQRGRGLGAPSQEAGAAQLAQDLAPQNPLPQDGASPEDGASIAGQCHPAQRRTGARAQRPLGGQLQRRLVPRRGHPHPRAWRPGAAHRRQLQQRHHAQHRRHLRVVVGLDHQRPACLRPDRDAPNFVFSLRASRSFWPAT